MNLKLENARYINIRGTLDNIRHGTQLFDIDVTDLDGVINNGKTFTYTYLNKDDDDSNSAIKQYIKSKLKELYIGYYYGDPELIIAIVEYKQCAISDIDDDFNTFVSYYDGIYFDNDVFSYNRESIDIINSIIACYDSQITNNKISADKVTHKFISCTNAVHDLTYTKLVELRNEMILRYSEVKLYARELKDKVLKAKTVDEIRNIRWDLWDL